MAQQDEISESPHGIARRLLQTLLLVGCFALSWFAMQAVHELGHVVVARFTGGKVVRVVLHPLAISRTDVEPNPAPLAVAWGGPVLGCLAPLVLYLLLREPEASVTGGWKSLAGFFAGFCLLANGLYLSLGSFDRVGDAGDILASGGQPWHLWLFGLATVPGGLWIWHVRAADFGFGSVPRSISPQRVAAIWIALAVLLGTLLLRG